jgi:hypothetical protein
MLFFPQVFLLAAVVSALPKSEEVDFENHVIVGHGNGYYMLEPKPFTGGGGQCPKPFTWHQCDILQNTSDIALARTCRYFYYECYKNDETGRRVEEIGPNGQSLKYFTCLRSAMLTYHLGGDGILDWISQSNYRSATGVEIGNWAFANSKGQARYWHAVKKCFKAFPPNYANPPSPEFLNPPPRPPPADA